MWLLNICQTRQEQCIGGKGYQRHHVIYHPQENLKMWTWDLYKLLLTLIRVHLGVLTGDLENPNSLISTVFTIWIRLMSLELRWFINWPNRNIIRRDLPSMFRKYYPNCYVIIDCSESNKSLHHTIKYLIEITPNGTVSYLSDCYRGRATDVFIVRDSGFLQKTTASGSSYCRQVVHDTRHASILSMYTCYPS